MVHTCSVYGCLSTAKNKELKFHRFPRDARCQSWIDACQRPDLKDKHVEQLYNMYVCSLHFEKWMYMKTKLKSAAIPIRKLPSANPSSTQTEAPIKDTDRDFHSESAENPMDATPVEAYVAISTNTSTQTTEQLTDYTPRKRKLQKEIKTWDKKMKLKEDAKSTDVAQLQFLQGCDDLLSPNLSRVRDMHSKGIKNQVNDTSIEVPVAASTSASSTQTTKQLTDPIPRKITHQKEIKTYDKKLKLIEEDKSTDITREQFLQACDKFLSPDLSEIVKKELNLRHSES